MTVQQSDWTLRARKSRLGIEQGYLRPAASQGFGRRVRKEISGAWNAVGKGDELGESAMNGRICKGEAQHHRCPVFKVGISVDKRLMGWNEVIGKKFTGGLVNLSLPIVLGRGSQFVRQTRGRGYKSLKG